MSARARALTPVAVVLLGLAAATAAFCLSNISYRASQYNGKQAGDVLVNGQVVMSLRTSAAGLDPLRRAGSIAERLAALPDSAFTGNQVLVREVPGGRALFVGDEPLVTVTAEEAQAHLTSPEVLAQVWQADLVEAATGAPPPAGPSYPPGTSVDWTGMSQKWVPILSIANEGARVGAAQVAGPTAQVRDVVGVAQLRLDFRNVARATVYVPVSSLSLSHLERVQGVSVWAIGDIGILNF
jgi:hypothetical protein